MSDKPEKKLADMTAAEIEAVIDAETEAYRKRMKYLKALAKAVSTN